MTKEELQSLILSQKIRVIDCSLDNIIFSTDEELLGLKSIPEISSWHEMHLMNGIHFHLHKLLPHTINGHNVHLGLVSSINDMLETKLIVRQANNSIYIWQLELEFSGENDLNRCGRRDFKINKMEITNINNKRVFEIILEKSHFTVFLGLRQKCYNKHSTTECYSDPKERLYILGGGYFLSVPIEFLLPDNFEKEYGRPEISNIRFIEKNKCSFHISSVHYRRYLVNTYSQIDVVFDFHTVTYDKFEVEQEAVSLK